MTITKGLDIHGNMRYASAMNLNYARTAIARGTKMSAPAMWIYQNYDLQNLDVINFGEGKAYTDTWMLHRVSNTCIGYDPYSNIKSRREFPEPADVVMAIYVLNVLPPVERSIVFRQMCDLAPVRLIALRTDHPSGRMFADGVLTQHNTFQRRYTPAEAVNEFGGRVLMSNSGFFILEV